MTKQQFRVIATGLLLFSLLCPRLFAAVTLPYVISDNMVIQRDIAVNIWGWAKPGEKVTVSLLNQKASTKADADGNWKVTLSPLAAGGPFQMTITGENKLVLNNILAGDVWVCSGQSNMEWPLSQSRNWSEDRLGTAHEQIRLFYVPKHVSSVPQNNTRPAQWELCNEESAAGFSAVGYYFGLALHRKLGVPVGLINSNWGGTDIETWTSLETMYADSDYRAQIDQMKTSNLEQLEKEALKRREEWDLKIQREDPGMKEKWYAPGTDVTTWSRMKLPQLWEGAGLPDLDGIVWFRREFLLDARQASMDAVLSLGPVDDSDVTYINGQEIGKTENQYDDPREYVIPQGLLKPGINTVVVKVTDTGGGGGFWGKKEQLFVNTGTERTDLAGDWQFKTGLDLQVPPAATGPNSFPSLLYNGMIHPLTRLGIKGAIWYQGENNASNFMKYRVLFPSMINDWRKQWHLGDFPFLFVQLANFMEPTDVPRSSSWAGLREAQAMTLSVPNTGMAVAIDIGEAKDIHPRNKDEVGLRLALAALKVAYGQEILHSGPIYKSMEVRGNRIVLTFDHAGEGLVARDSYGYLKAFAIAGADREFKWAQARIVGKDQVEIWNDKISTPVAVRYAWADNPEDANLYNSVGLPASPFRSDIW